MDLRNILKSLTSLSEATKETGKGRIHTAEPGGYGRKDDEDGEGKKVAQPAVKRGRGRPKKDADSSGEVKTYDTKSLGSVFGGGQKPKKEVGKRSVKHSLKEFIEEVEGQTQLDEGEQLTLKPMPGASQIVGADGKVIGTADSATANTLKAAAQKGTLDLAGDDEQLEEKAVSKAQQRFFGMVDAAKHGKKPASAAVAKVAKSMKQSDVHDFARTKHKGLPNRVSESILKDDAGETLEHIANRFKHEVKSFQQTGEMDTDLYEALFDYYSNAGEMPYGIAKARTGDPYEWVSQRFEQDYGLEEGIRTPAVPMGKTTTLPFGSKPSIVQKPAAMRKASGQNFPLTTAQVGDRSNDLTNPATTTGLIKDLSKKSPFAFESKEMKDIQLENWEKELNSLLNEGITVTSSTGQQGMPDSVSINATDADAQELLAIVRGAGLGVFGGEEQEHSAYGAPMDPHGAEPEGSGTAPEVAPEVVGDGDDMMALIKRMAGIGGEEGSDQTTEPGMLEPADAGSDYEDEEGSEEESGEEHDDSEEGEDSEEETTDEGNAFGAAVAKAKSDGVQQGEKVSVGGKEYPVQEEDEQADQDYDGDGEIESGKDEYLGSKIAAAKKAGNMEEGAGCCAGCGMNEADCSCDTEQVDEEFANEPDEEFAKLKALLSMGNDLNRPKRSQTVGNPTKVAFESTDALNDWKKLSGIK